MSRYRAMFQRLGGDGAFGAFVMLGDPDLPTSARRLDELAEAGADMIEVGIPFSDPVADGPVIQAAAQRALAAGVRVNDCFALIADFRAGHPDVPIGILTYANLVLARGCGNFFSRAAAAGADSLLVADLPAREAEPWATAMRSAGLDPVLIAAANTPRPTLEEIARLGSGYTYCVTRAGITGVHAAAEFDRSLLQALAAARAAPPVFGFGISRPEHVRAAMAAGAAGVISGSAIVACAADGGDVRALVAELKAATRNDSPA
jgi:tryptophan synthase alpha chain